MGPRADIAASTRAGAAVGAESAPPDAELETHVSVLTFWPTTVRKRKKPVRFPFIDLSTPELRAAECRNEVALNSRLAPDVYLGVDEERGSDGRLIDAAVVMRRLPAKEALSERIASGEDVVHDLDAIARRLVSFHTRADRGPHIDAAATPEAICRRWDQDLDELEPQVRALLGLETLGRQRRIVHRYIAGRTDLLTQRIAQGHVVDGHGDLQATDIFCLSDGPRILDCVEFDPALRYGDELADIGFLAMDLESRGRQDLADYFVERCDVYANHHFPASLLNLYVAQKAAVRAKVALIRAGQGDVEAVEDARSHLRVMFRRLELARIVLVIVGGAPGTGKSTTAAGLASALGAVHLRSDEVRRDIADTGRRRRLVGYKSGAYSAMWTAATYRQLASRAGILLRHGESVVLDATFPTSESRRRARQAGLRSWSDVVGLECHASQASVHSRVARRLHRGLDLSQVTPAVALRLRSSREPWPDAHHISTEHPLSAVLAECLRHIGQTPVGGEPLP